jgi:arylesterase/paraoxonase
MSRLLRGIVTSIVLLVVASAAAAIFLLNRAGAFVHLSPHFAGTCEQLSLPGSTADIRVDRGTHTAYLSVLDRRALLEGKEVGGTILRLDLASSPLVAAPALSDAPTGFRPRGISLYTAPDGQQWLFALSDPADAPHTVEIFSRTDDGQFAYRETLHNPLLFSPHSIIAVGARQFYVTNDSGARSGLERLTERAFGRALSSLVYYDGSAMRVIDAVAGGAGIAASADGGRIYVGQAGGRSVRVYARDSANGDLTPVEDVSIYSTPDRLDVAEDGALWIAAHPNMLEFVHHLREPRQRAGTQVLRVAADPLTQQRLGEVYLNLGDELSAGSVAAPAKDGFLLGAVLDPQLLVCRLSQ